MPNDSHIVCPIRIIFMGTPEFAVASLDAILIAGYNVVAVITAPDKPAGRGMQLTISAVKKFALEKGLKILQPEKLKNPEFLEELKSLAADLQIVVAFRMLPEVVWTMPPMGTVNLHGSLLPQYRGAAPINWAVINGETETGVTTFKLQHEIDTGNILLQDRFPISPAETAGEVHDRMKDIGARLLVRTIDGLVTDTLTPLPQENPTDLRHAPKIFTETCRIDWTRPTDEIYNLIRGLSPFPAAFTHLDGKLLKIYRSEKETPAASHAAVTPPSSTVDTIPAPPDPDAGAPKINRSLERSLLERPLPGTPETDQKSYLRFSTADGYIRIIELQLEGKKKMKIEDFLRGYKPPRAENQPS